MRKINYIVEHLEPRLFEWCILEYRHISRLVGKENLVFTNVKKDSKKLKSLGKVYKESVSSIKFKNACILDPLAYKTLAASDTFDCLILGGILGDFPAKARTRKELSAKLPCQARNLGKNQFSTDTAVYIAKEIMHGKALGDFTFQDGISIKLNKIETVDLPFAYVIVNGKPLLPPGLIRHLRKRKEF